MSFPIGDCQECGQTFYPLGISHEHCTRCNGEVKTDGDGYEGGGPCVECREIVCASCSSIVPRVCDLCVAERRIA